MKTPYKNIYNILKLNRFIVLTVVIGAVLTCISSRGAHATRAALSCAVVASALITAVIIGRRVCNIRTGNIN